MDAQGSLQLQRREGRPDSAWRFDTRRSRQPLWSHSVWRGIRKLQCTVFPVLRDGVQAVAAETEGRQLDRKILRSFKGGTAEKEFGDGANPNGGLVLDSAGAVCGTTYYGGNESGECDAA